MEQMDEQLAEHNPWYAIKLFSLKQKEVEDYFISNNVETFIPKQWQVVEGADGKPKRQLRPVVHNLVFVKKMFEEQQMRAIVSASQHKISVIKKSDDSTAFYEIPPRQMREFMLMCNPDVTIREFLTEQDAHMKPGAEVFVKFGPLKGLSGRLVRISRKYYLLKEVPGMGVALKVSRWCCVPKN